MPELIFLNILLPSLRDVAIVKERELVVEAKFELVCEDVLAGVLHYWVVCEMFFYFEFAVFLFWDFDDAVYDVVF